MSNKEYASIFLPKDLRDEIKIEAAKEKVSMMEFLNKLLELWRNQHANKLKMPAKK